MNLLFEHLREISALESEVFDTFTSRQRTPSGHVFLGGCAYKTEDELRLIEIAAARQYWFAFEHLAENTSEMIRTLNVRETSGETHPTPHMSMAVVYRRN